MHAGKAVLYMIASTVCLAIAIILYFNMQDHPYYQDDGFRFYIYGIPLGVIGLVGIIAGTVGLIGVSPFKPRKPRR